MEVFTAKEFQERWDELIKRVEQGEHIGVINDEGHAAVMISADDDILKLYVEENNEAP
jgi:PHD/YefM family antitoxin component YafN of YafNO toxin-antitoxin module